MKTFELTLQQDKDKVTIRTRAMSLAAAKRIACAAEAAPESAIVTWRVVPTKRQIARTKRWLGGMR